MEGNSLGPQFTASPGLLLCRSADNSYHQLGSWVSGGCGQSLGCTDFTTPWPKQIKSPVESFEFYPVLSHKSWKLLSGKKLSVLLGGSLRALEIEVNGKRRWCQGFLHLQVRFELGSGGGNVESVCVHMCVYMCKRVRE